MVYAVFELSAITDDFKHFLPYAEIVHPLLPPSKRGIWTTYRIYVPEPRLSTTRETLNVLKTSFNIGYTFKGYRKKDWKD